MWLSDEAKIKLHSLGYPGSRISGFQLSYEFLIREGNCADRKAQAALPCIILDQVYEVALWVWEKIDADVEFKAHYIKIFQGVSGPYTEILGKLMDAIERQKVKKQQRYN